MIYESNYNRHGMMQNIKNITVYSFVSDG